MKILKCLFIITSLITSLNILAEENLCPENYMWVDYHNSCMAIPPTPVCPEGEMWVDYHNACVAVAPVAK